MHTQPSEHPTFSVVIPCYNEAAEIGNLLDDLRKQTTQAANIAVVDCNSQDGTAAIAQQYAGKLPLHVLQSPSRSAAAARNHGTQTLQDTHPTDYIVFIDADMRVSPDFLSTIRAVLQTHSVDFVTPRFVSDGKHWADTIGIRQVNAMNKRAIRHGRVSGIGGTMVVRSTTHKTAGGFPVGVKQDDLQYVTRLSKMGVAAHYAANVTVVNSSRRMRQEGILVWFFGVLNEGSWLEKIAGKLVGRDLSQRRYGHYTKK